MDVIIDTCILLEAPSMRSAEFGNLFDYVRKTKSQVILPRIVFDEVLTRYPEKLSERSDKARAAAGLLNATAVTAVVPACRDLDIAQETDQYRNFLSSGVREGQTFPIRVLPDYAGIDPKEVAERGIKRIPPSNSNGEQLRDVLVWLASVSYCRVSGKPVAFISSDKDFLTKDGTKIKDELASELGRDHIELRVYSSVKEFLKFTAPTPIDLSKDWVVRHISMSQLKELIETYAWSLAAGVWHGERTVTVLRSEVDVRGGKLYDIGPGAQLAEVEIAGQIAIRVSDWPYPPPWRFLPEEEAREVRGQTRPLRSEDHELNASLFVSLQLQNEKVVDVAPQRFEYQSPPEATLLASSPVIFQRS